MPNATRTEENEIRILGVCKCNDAPRGGAQSTALNWVIQSGLMARKLGLPLSIDFVYNANPLVISKHLHGSPLEHVLWSLSMTKKIKKLYRKKEYDIYHIHQYSGYCPFPPEPNSTIVTLYDEPLMGYLDNISPIHARVIDLTVRKSAQAISRLALLTRPWIHAPSSTVKYQLLQIGYPEERIRVIPYGFDVHQSKNIPELSKEDALKSIGLKGSERYVLSIGNIDFRKGYYRILRACEYLKRNGVDLHFIIAGCFDNILHKALAHTLISLAKDWKLDNFHLSGYLPYNVLQSLLYHCDVFLSASYSETGPLVLMEAAQTGVPIVATDVGATRDFLEGQISILDRYCSGWEIARAIIQARKMKRVTYECVERFSWEKVSQKMLDFYQDVKSEKEII